MNATPHSSSKRSIDQRRAPGQATAHSHGRTRARPAAVVALVVLGLTALAATAQPAPTCGHILRGGGIWWSFPACTAPAVCGGGGVLGACGAPPWTHVTSPYGGYDYPLVTYWNGEAWLPNGIKPDPRSEQPGQPIHLPLIDYNLYAWERTGHPRSPEGERYQPADFDHAMKIISSTTGFPVHYYNSWDALVTDGTAPGVQVLPMVYTGTPVAGSFTPEADPPGPGNNSGASLFSILFPPGYDAGRAQRYPLLIISPGGGGTHLHAVLGPVAISLENTARLLAESVQTGGSGLIVVYTNAGGQGSHGLQVEHQDAYNEIVDRLHDIGNADRSRVVTTGGSRGGSNALFHGSRPNRSYTTLAAFAGVPPSHFGGLAKVPLNLSSLHSFFNLSNFAPTSALGTANPALFDGLSAIGQVAFWDSGAWVELCGGPRDWVSGGGILYDYYKSLPSQVTGRLNNVFGSGHGGNGLQCTEHLNLFVLDILVGNTAYAGRFSAQVSPGVFHYRLSPNTISDPFPAALPSDYEAISASGCGGEMPVSLVMPFQQQRDTSTSPDTFEESGFIVTGDTGRAWEVDLLPLGSSTPLATWSGVLGGAATQPDCEPFPQATSATGSLCRFDDASELCTSIAPYQVCTFALRYDCDNDGTPEAIAGHYTPFRNDPPAQGIFGPNSQPETRLVVAPWACFSFEQCGLATAPGSILPHNPHTGWPQVISPALNYGNLTSTP